MVNLSHVFHSCTNKTFFYEEGKGWRPGPDLKEERFDPAAGVLIDRLTKEPCILAVGGTKQVPVVKNGVVVPGNVMKVTLSCDHRVVDGVAGSKFLQSFKNYMENPIVLLGAQNI